MQVVQHPLLMASVCGADFYLCEGPSHFSDVSDRTLGKQTRRVNSGERPCDTEHFMSNVMNIIRICRENENHASFIAPLATPHTRAPLHTHISHGHTHTRDLLHTPHTPCTRHAHATHTPRKPCTHIQNTHTRSDTPTVRQTRRHTPSNLELTCNNS